MGPPRYGHPESEEAEKLRSSGAKNAGTPPQLLSFLAPELLLNIDGLAEKVALICAQ